MFRNSIRLALCGIFAFPAVFGVCGVAATANEPLTPRPIYEKPAHVELKDYHYKDIISVKFRDGLMIRLRNDVLTDLGTGAMAKAQAVLDSVAGGRWEREHSVPEEKLDEWRAKGQANSGKALADLNLYFMLHLPEGADAGAICDAFNALTAVELAVPVPMPDLPPSTVADFEPNQEYLDAAPKGMFAECAWLLPGGTGVAVQIADIEYSWNTFHQDLPTPTVIGCPPVDPFNDNNHGTAVLGEIGALDNGVGTTGIAHDARLFFVGARQSPNFPSCTQPHDFSVARAIMLAVNVLQPGDIILIEQQTPGPNVCTAACTEPCCTSSCTNPGTCGRVPVEWNQAVYNAIRNAVMLGYIVVEAAGNGGENLDDPIYSTTPTAPHDPFLPANDSGAIIVGSAFAPASSGGTGTPLSRRPTSTFGSTLELQGWGEEIWTTGYGGNPPDGFSACGTDRWYTGEMSGTSGASAMVAGACALLQSIHKTANGFALTPAAMLSMLGGIGSSPQAFNPGLPGRVGPFPNLAAAISFAVPSLDANGNLVPDACQSPAPRIFFDPPVSTIAPGQAVTLKVFVETLPPFGIQLKSYAMQVPDSVVIGGNNNTLNHYAGAPSPLIDTTEPSFVFSGESPFTATTDPPPEFSAQVIGSVSVPPGTRYLGEVTYTASPSANGSFEISLLYPNVYSRLRDQNNNNIPLTTAFPGAIIQVRPNAFGTPVSYPSGSIPLAIASGDINADGDNDVVVAHNAGYIATFENNGSGQLTPTFLGPNFGQNTYDVALADVDADGDLDLAAPTGTFVVVQFNTGSGNFVGGGSVTVNYGATSPTSIVAADFDGDCDIDLATANLNAPTNTLTVLRNNNGSFTSVTMSQYAAGPNPRSIAAGDMDGNGDPDVIVSNHTNNNITIIKNFGGAFGATASYPTGLTSGCLERVVVGDWDTDGDLDVAVSDCQNKVVTMKNTNGAGNLGNAQVYTVGSFPWNMATADVDGDDDLDLITSHVSNPAQIQLLINSGNGAFSAGSSSIALAVNSGPRELTLSDLDGDGREDLVAALGSQDTVATLVNITAHDCNGDGVDDALQPGGTKVINVANVGPLPNGTPCEWLIVGGGYSCQATVCIDTGGTYAAYAQVLVDSINANCCPTIRATREPGSTNSFRIRTPGPIFDFCVGSPPCCLSPSVACSCNPDLVLLSETDCNKNGEDDAIDLYLSTSSDENGNHIPDECDCAFNGQCNDFNQCTSDVCANGNCVNFLSFNPSVECCDPDGGLIVPMDDGNECTIDICDTSTGTISHHLAPPASDCDDGDSCTYGDACDDVGQCAGLPIEFFDIICEGQADACPPGTVCGPEGTCSCCRTGDVNCNGIINLDDILYILNGFGNFPAYPNSDIHPCDGNGFVNLDDILWVLRAFAGENMCP